MYNQSDTAVHVELLWSNQRIKPQRHVIFVFTNFIIIILNIKSWEKETIHFPESTQNKSRKKIHIFNVYTMSTHSHTFPSHCAPSVLYTVRTQVHKLENKQITFKQKEKEKSHIHSIQFNLVLCILMISEISSGPRSCRIIQSLVQELHIILLQVWFSVLLHLVSTNPRVHLFQFKYLLRPCCTSLTAHGLSDLTFKNASDPFLHALCSSHGAHGFLGLATLVD